MLGTQDFIFSFSYNRWRKVKESLVALDQNLDDYINDPIINLDVWYKDEVITTLQTRSSATLHNVRMDLQTEQIDIPKSFSFQINYIKVCLYQSKHYKTFDIICCIGKTLQYLHISK